MILKALVNDKNIKKGFNYHAFMPSDEVAMVFNNVGRWKKYPLRNFKPADHLINADPSEVRRMAVRLDEIHMALANPDGLNIDQVQRLTEEMKKIKNRAREISGEDYVPGEDR